MSAFGLVICDVQMSLFFPADPNLQVMVSRASQYSTWAELKCHSRCRLPDHSSFIWYKNGQKIQDETPSIYTVYLDSSDSYSCAVKGFEHRPAPSVCEFTTQSLTNKTTSSGAFNLLYYTLYLHVIKGQHVIQKLT